MSDIAVEKMTPQKGGKVGAKKLDHQALIMEYALELEKLGGKVNWNTIAEAVGSASGESAQKTWQNLKKKHGQGGASGENVVLKARATKIEKEKKPRPPRKPKNKDAEGENGNAPTTPKRKSKPKDKDASPKKGKKGKAAKNGVPNDDDDEEKDAAVKTEAKTEVKEENDDGEDASLTGDEDLSDMVAEEDLEQ